MTYTILTHHFFTVFFTIFGTLLGSFSNVVILRMSSGKSVIFPPSSCPKCDHQLHAIDLIPVFSWLFLKGKCRYCKTPISYQYPLVEATIAAITGITFYRHGLSLAFIVGASRAIIWFIASVILLRREVKQPDPFLWAAIYFTYLNFPIGGCPFIDRRVLSVPFIAALIGFFACIKDQKHFIAGWGCLSFIFIYSLLPKFSLLAAIPLIIPAVLNVHAKTQPAAGIIFFSMQLAAITSLLFS